MKSVIRHAGVPTIAQFAGAPGPAIVIDTDTGTQYWLDAGDTVTEVAGGGGGGLTTEQVDDRVAALLVAGSNVTLTYNDGAGTLTIASSGGGGSGSSYFPSGW